MKTVTSKDDTKIAYDQIGRGPALVLVGATPDRSANAQLVEFLSPHFTIYNYDRRGHGNSGDTQPWAFEREVEDLEAVINAAGGSVFAYGSLGNGIFVLKAAAHGLTEKIVKQAIWETPFIIEGSRPPVPVDYKEQLEKLLAEGRHGDMVELFLTTAVGMPAEFVTPMRSMPGWSAFEAAAPTLIYDASVVGDFSIPKELEKVTIPTLVLDGGQAASPWIRTGLDALMKILPRAERRSLEGQQHNVDSAALAPALVEFFKA